MKNNVALFLLMLSLLSCTGEKHVEQVPETDAQLLAQALETDGFVWYKASSSILPSASASEHTPFFRVRFNALAASVLGADGKLPPGVSFPEGSLVVKELFRSPEGSIELVAVMKKNQRDPNAVQQWIWSEYYADGRVLISAGGKGAACVNCHSIDDRDFIRVFDLF